MMGMYLRAANNTALIASGSSISLPASCALACNACPMIWCATAKLRTRNSSWGPTDDLQIRYAILRKWSTIFVPSFPDSPALTRA
jgi:hypothetical protein